MSEGGDCGDSERLLELSLQLSKNQQAHGFIILWEFQLA